MEHQIQLKRNINKNYLFVLLGNIDLTRGIWMIYLAGKGLSLTQLGLLETIFHIASFTMEVPTGAVADLFGRKASRVLSRLCSLISVIILLLSDSFYLFALSFVLTALSYNLESGAGDALVYDSLKEIGEEQRYLKICGNKEIFYQIAGTVSFLLGGYFATKSYGIAFSLTIIIGFITLLQSMTFREPSIGKLQAAHEKENLFLRQLKESVAVLKNKPKILFLTAITQSIMAFCTCIFYYLQNYLKGDGYNEAVIGLIYALSSLLAAVTASQIHRIERTIKEQGILLLIPFLTAICIWGVALSRVHYIFFIVMMLTEGIIYVSVNDYINKMIPSENRATILSFTSMLFSFFMITMFPLIGVLGDRYSLRFAFICLGTAASLLAIANAIFLVIKRKKQF